MSMHPQGLQVSIAATHAGIITRNNGFYLPDRMKKGAPTFIENYAKPVLVHHQEHSDPIGRIIDSIYVDTSGVVRDQFDLVKGIHIKNRAGKEIGILNDVLLQDFIAGKLPFGMAVDTVCSLLRDSIIRDSTYEGLGYLQILANITDQAAITKFLDGRYLTGSVGATTNQAICSTCRQDWTESGKCEHTPGAIYDGAPCFIIAGDLIYDEYSVVNFPADRHSKVLQLNCNGIKDEIEIANTGRVYEVAPSFPQFKERLMDALDNSQEVGDQVETPVDETIVEDSTQEETQEDILTVLMDAETLTDEQEEQFYELLWAEVQGAITDGELAPESEDVRDSFLKEIEDAKLSTKQRKDLSKSTFCGPNKSFPVPDCAHVVAARRLIGRYKGPGDKSTILACVSRKAKKLGCDTKSKDETQQPTQDSYQHSRIMHMLIEALEDGKPFEKDGEAVFEAEELKVLQGILKRLATMVGKDNLVLALVNEELALSPVCEDKLLEEIIQNEEKIGELRDEIETLKQEHMAMFKDTETLKEKLVESVKQVRKAKEMHLAILQNLNDKEVKERDFATLTDEVLDTETINLAELVDFQGIVNKIGDGMSRTPTEIVDDPTQVQDEIKEQVVTPEDLGKIEEQYLKLLFSPGQGPTAAAKYIQRCQAMGKLPTDNG